MQRLTAQWLLELMSTTVTGVLVIQNEAAELNDELQWLL